MNGACGFRNQRGWSTVASSLVLLFGLSMVLFYLHRQTLFEQRTAINQVRAVQADALARSGLAWAQVALNEAAMAPPSCRGAATSMRHRLMDAASPAPVLQAVCRWDAGEPAPHCTCSGAAPLVAWPGDAAPQQGFVVTMHRHASDPWALELRSTGCVGAAAPCEDAAGPGTVLAESRASQTLRILPLLRRRPVAAVVSGGDVQACSPAMVINADASTPGWWAHAGGNAAAACGSGEAGAAIASVAGSPVSARDRDHALAHAAQGAADGDGFFALWFGTGAASYRHTACRPDGATPGARGADLHRQWTQGCRRFLIEQSIAFEADAPLGTADEPVALVLLGDARIEGVLTLHGLLYADVAASPWHGALRVEGALISRGAVQLQGATRVQLDDALLQRLSERAGWLLPVPGSWRDE
jgi:hypothetical protein